jgi:purine-binding chemotaxis protein CheW
MKAPTRRSERQRLARMVAGDDLLQLAVFRIADREYALDIMRIKEIIRALPVTPVPKAPSFVEGVVELRGSIIPLVDLRKRFEAPVAATGRLTRYIVVAMEGRIIGLLVDEVLEVIRVRREEVRPAPTMLATDDAEYFLGVYLRQGRIMMIVNPMKLLSSGERHALWSRGNEGPSAGPAEGQSSEGQGAR